MKNWDIKELFGTIGLAVVIFLTTKLGSLIEYFRSQSNKLDTIQLDIIPILLILSLIIGLIVCLIFRDLIVRLISRKSEKAVIENKELKTKKIPVAVKIIIVIFILFFLNLCSVFLTNNINKKKITYETIAYKLDNSFRNNPEIEVRKILTEQFRKSLPKEILAQISTEDEKKIIDIYEDFFRNIPYTKTALENKNKILSEMGMSEIEFNRKINSVSIAEQEKIFHHMGKLIFKFYQNDEDLAILESKLNPIIMKYAPKE